jgi:hypothetical protein
MILLPMETRKFLLVVDFLLDVQELSFRDVNAVSLKEI